MKKFAVTLFISMVTEVCSAQESVSALYPYSMIQYQPSFPASDDIASISVLGRRTYITSSLLLENNSLMLEFPLQNQKSGRRFGGIGLFASEKNAGASDILKSTTLNLSIAYNVNLSRRHSINFGLQPSYIEKRTSLDHVSTGSQWLASEFRFDPTADLGENFQVDRLRYFTVHSGIVWRFKDKAINNLGSLGISVFNLNKPKESFLAAQSRITPSWLIEGELSLVRSNAVVITPKCFVQIDPLSTLITSVLALSFPFTNRNPYDVLRSGSVGLSSNYIVQSAGNFICFWIRFPRWNASH
jgi:type IX secretion system PorP/SprF family membrane protein